jgi:hypothetical protein
MYRSPFCTTVAQFHRPGNIIKTRSLFKDLEAGMSKVRETPGKGFLTEPCYDGRVKDKISHILERVQKRLNSSLF